MKEQLFGLGLAGWSRNTGMMECLKRAGEGLPALPNPCELLEEAGRARHSVRAEYIND
jgi:hypothetical protein